MAIGEFRGVGAKTKPVLEDMGIQNGADLLEYSQVDLVQRFGKMGLGLYQHARGIDNRPVLVRDRKSIGKERTYRAVKTTDAQVEQELKHLAEMVAETLASKQKHGKTVVLKVRDRDFNTITKRTSLPQFINQATDIFNVAWQLWEQIKPQEIAIRLLGITVTGLKPNNLKILICHCDWYSCEMCYT